MSLNPRIESLPNIGTSYGRKLHKLGIDTLEDLIYHFPFRYEDYSKLTTTQNLTDGEKISIQGTILQIKNIRTRTGKFITNAQVADESGIIDVIWFNQTYLTKTLKAGTPVSLSGKVKMEYNKPKLIAPVYEILRTQNPVINQAETIHTANLISVYPETEGLSSKWLRSKIRSFLVLYTHDLEDFLPKTIITEQKLLDLNSSLEKIHFPKKFEDVELSRKRLGFDELFLLQLLSIIRRQKWQKQRKATKMQIDRKKINTLIADLPFILTGAQNRSIESILSDLKKPIPMNRLLEGDVGSGKTVVAAVACLVSYLNGFDTLIAAPTEILAFQHQTTLESILKTAGIKVGIWTGSKKIKGDITCGTHALLTSYKSKKQLGLVVVDEQHRFGVAQRAKLFLKSENELTPHVLTMTATPIPRTLALTIYGDLDLSQIDEMPKGRIKISTFVVPNNKRNDAYKFIEKQVQEGRQVFIITPFVEPSESMVTVKSAIVEFEKLTKIFSSFRKHVILSTSTVTPNRVKSLSVNSTKNLKQQKNKRSFGIPQDDKKREIKLGLLHGRLKSKEKEKIINSFKSGKIDVLVATPVVEVGIDVPNANLILIESAERFGLAQLHQLRGRVGRDVHKSYCLLFTESKSPQAQTRLKSMEKVFIGAQLAEIDLKMRGPGEIFGLKQSGFVNLKIADLSDHQSLIVAQTEAKKIVEIDPALKNYPLLAQKLSQIESQYSEPT